MWLQRKRKELSIENADIYVGDKAWNIDHKKDLKRHIPEAVTIPYSTYVCFICIKPVISN